jgi:hypothetical protein
MDRPNFGFNLLTVEASFSRMPFLHSGKMRDTFFVWEAALGAGLMNLSYVRKSFFGQIFIPELWTKYHANKHRK